MDGYDRSIIEFVLSWAPYGGPPAGETFCQFGITTEILRLRFISTVSAHAAQRRALSGHDIRLITRACAYLRPTLDAAASRGARQFPQGRSAIPR